MIPEDILDHLEEKTVAPVPPLPSAWQLRVKRLVDLTGATVGLMFALPVIAVLALAIFAQDRSSPFISQTRVGRYGKTFKMLKLRTMVPNAETMLGEIASLNQREFPLFKAALDPRVTRIGRLLRATSLDELPQLINVVQGTMSLVGPRPALPHEREEFDSELRLREILHPGITGLWQVEARDQPSFASYRTLDLHYLTNWSLKMDLSIMLATPSAVVRRATVGRRRIGT